MTFAWIAAEKAEFPIATLCQVMRVSTSGFYASCRRPESAHTRTDRRLRVLVHASFDESKQRYGSPRIHEDLLVHLISEEGARSRKNNDRGDIPSQGVRWLQNDCSCDTFERFCG